MKIFLDTTNLEEIQKATNFGLLDGITTNPTLAAKAGLPFPELILTACEIMKDGVVNAEVVSTDTEGMLREGRERASWHSNIVVSHRPW
jgi:transaldolase